MTAKRKILITSALIYANGDVHLGHLTETIQTDIFARALRAVGHEVYYICADDAHGTPIMVNAEKQGLLPQQLVDQVYDAHVKDLKDFYIDFDYYGSTQSDENQKFCAEIYEKLKANGDIETREIAQAYDAQASMFLPDRYVKGTCPRCQAKNQYGDNCEVCGATYTTAELIDPVSVISGKTPIEKTSLHYFFKLENYTSRLKAWLGKDHVSAPVVNKLNEWFEAGLASWDISRDQPYFGFKIPDTENKYFYVWFDAPIGYIATFASFCQKNQLDFDAFWRQEQQTELYHFIGKDIIYFHALFWPAMLMGSGFRKPTKIFAHGFLTVNGEKMSKSRGTFINAKTYLKYLDPEYLRYYFAAKLSDSIEDIDLNFADFRYRVNSDLVGKFINIASRCAGFITKKANSLLSSSLHDAALYQKFTAKQTEIASLYEKREFQRVVREVMLLADLANQYIDEYKPWLLAKTAGNEILVQAVCSQGINLFLVLMVYLSPILPHMANQVSQFLNIDSLNWQTLKQPLLNHQINPFESLMQRISDEAIENLLNG